MTGVQTCALPISERSPDDRKLFMPSLGLLLFASRTRANGPLRSNPNERRGQVPALTLICPHASLPTLWTLQWATGQASPCFLYRTPRGPILEPKKDKGPHSIWSRSGLAQSEGPPTTCSRASGTLSPTPSCLATTLPQALGVRTRSLPRAGTRHSAELPPSPDLRTYHRLGPHPGQERRLQPGGDRKSVV